MAPWNKDFIDAARSCTPLAARYPRAGDGAKVLVCSLIVVWVRPAYAGAGDQSFVFIEVRSLRDIQIGAAVRSDHVVHMLC